MKGEEAHMTLKVWIQSVPCRWRSAVEPSGRWDECRSPWFFVLESHLLILFFVETDLMS